MKGSSMQSFVTQFFAELEREDISFMILRGNRNLEELREGSDIDLIVAPKDAARLASVLNTLSDTLSIHVWESFRAGFLTQYYLHTSQEDEHQFFEIDVHTSEACFGVSYLSASKFLSEDSCESGAARAVANFLTPFLSGGEVNARYRGELLEQLSENEPTVRKTLNHILGSRKAAAFLLAISSDSKFQRASSYRSELLKRCFFRSPIRSTIELARFFYSVRIAPFMRPRGRFVALLGTDGSGKSTLARELSSRLKPIFREGGVHEFHMRPGLLPQLRSLLTLKKTVYSAEEISNPHNSKPSGRIGSAVRVLYYWCDYVVGSLLRIAPLRRRNSLVLFDRYFDDYQVDPLRARIQPGSSLPTVLTPRTPRPDVILVCTADLETVQSRKQEHNVEESARQIAAYEALAENDPRIRIINTGGTLTETTNKAIEAIFAEAAA